MALNINDFKYNSQVEMEMIITPEIAQLFYDNNYPENRTIRPSKVEAYALDMKNGNWDTDISRYQNPIIITDDPYLYDGQHRCLGSIKSGKSFKTRIIFGVHDPDRTLFKLLDGGCPRRTADFISVPNANSITSIAKVFIALRDGEAPVLSSLQGKLKASKVSPSVTRQMCIDAISKNNELFQKIHTEGRKMARTYGRSRGTFCDCLTLIYFTGRSDALNSFIKDFCSDVPVNPTITAGKSYLTKKFCSNTFDTSSKWLLGTLLCIYENFRNGTTTSVFNKWDAYIDRYNNYVEQARKCYKKEA